MEIFIMFVYSLSLFSHKNAQDIFLSKHLDKYER